MTTDRIEIGVRAPSPSEAVELAKAEARLQGYALRTVCAVRRGDSPDWWIVELSVRAKDGAT